MLLTADGIAVVAKTRLQSFEASRGHRLKGRPSRAAFARLSIRSDYRARTRLQGLPEARDRGASSGVDDAQHQIAGITQAEDAQLLASSATKGSPRPPSLNGSAATGQAGAGPKLGIAG
jgi:hypothetical protein